MRITSRSCLAALVLLAAAPLTLLVPAPLAAQAQPAQDMVKQIPLTAEQIEGFIAAQKKIGPLIEKLPETGAPSPKLLAKLDAVAKSYKFKDYADYDLVASNIGLVMAGIDPQTKKYIGAAAVLKSQIAAVEADKKMNAKDKKAQLEDLKAALKSVQPVTIPGNITLVLKYYDKIIAALPQD